MIELLKQTNDLAKKEQFELVSLRNALKIEKELDDNLDYSLEKDSKRSCSVSCDHKY